MGRCVTCDWSETAGSVYRNSVQLSKNNTERRRYLKVLPDGRELCSYCEQEEKEVSVLYKKEAIKLNLKLKTDEK
jgi:hypothetical protein